ncbi:hypothetical protein ASD11_06650 [Aeromicrobium sp. Root495]|nr:hypothetical protein ASD11_06650 [Aeromicrobium sp. Root495]
MVVHSVLLGVLVLALGFCGFMVVSDELSHEDAWDGLGTALGLWGGALTLVAIGVAALLLSVSRRGRRERDRSRVAWSSTVTMLIAGVWLVCAWPSLRPGETGSWVLALSPALVALPVAGGALTSALRAR